MLVAVIEVILVLALVGMVMYGIHRYAPMAQGIKTMLNWVAIVVVVIWLLSVFGFWRYLGI
jgi:hypothetical protein